MIDSQTTDCAALTGPATAPQRAFRGDSPVSCPSGGTPNPTTITCQAGGNWNVAAPVCGEPGEGRREGSVFTRWLTKIKSTVKSLLSLQTAMPQPSLVET